MNCALGNDRYVNNRIVMTKYVIFALLPYAIYSIFFYTVYFLFFFLLLLLLYSITPYMFPDKEKSGPALTRKLATSGAAEDCVSSTCGAFSLVGDLAQHTPKSGYESQTKHGMTLDMMTSLH